MIKDFVLFKMQLRTPLLLCMFAAIALFLFTSCSDKHKDNCSNPDAVNYDPEGKNPGNCIFPSDQIQGIYGFEVVEYPLQGSQVGTVHQIEIRDADCYGPEKAYKYVQFFSMQSPFSPMDFCLFVDGYDFTITDEMNVTWTGADVTGTGFFSANKDFEFSGTIHRQNGDQYPIKLKGK